MKKIIMDKELLNFTREELCIKKGEGLRLKEIYENYKRFVYLRGEKPMLYWQFRKFFEEILDFDSNFKQRDVEITKKNGCFFVTNIMRGREFEGNILREYYEKV